MFNIKKLLGLGTSVGIEAVKEHIENDVVNMQITALEVSVSQQIEDNEEDILEIVELKEQLENLQVTLEIRNGKYEKLLDVLS